MASVATVDLADVSRGHTHSQEEDGEMLEMMRRVKRMRINDQGKSRASQMEEENFQHCHKGTAVHRAAMEGWWEPNKDIIHALADHLKACGVWISACKNLRLVNKHWSHQVSQHLTALSPHASRSLPASHLIEHVKPGQKFSGVRHLNLMSCGPLRGDRRGCFRMVTKLESLALGGDWVTNEVCECLTWQTALRNLWLGESLVSSRGLRYLSGLKTLRCLDLHLRIGVSPACLSRFKHLENLKLSCAAPILDEDDLLGLSCMQRLQSLSLVNSGVDLYGLKGIARLINLVRLEVWCDKVYFLDQACHDFARGLPNLSFLGLISSHNLTDDGLGAIAGLANLSHLSLIQCPKISPTGMRRLTTLEGLRFLKLYNNDLVGLRVFSRLHKLEGLHLGGMDEVGDAHLTCLQSLTCLTSLKFFQSPNVGGVVMGTLAHLRIVKEFELVCCKTMQSQYLLHNLQSACFGPLQDQMLCDVIASCPGLVSLSLMECTMSPYAVEVMGTLRRLKHLRLWHCRMLNMEMLALYSRHWMDRLEVLDLCPLEQFDGGCLRNVMLCFPHLKVQETATVG
ncbi:hypothetical protein BSKO_06817 [Bryopsis sp. KO-2023]|nr:hypothetical protein BSKO_06817 [Bryopsis sp. KO-2023]